VDIFLHDNEMASRVDLQIFRESGYVNKAWMPEVSKSPSTVSIVVE
jgi:hypothetical protein